MVSKPTRTRVHWLHPKKNSSTNFFFFFKKKKKKKIFDQIDFLLPLLFHPLHITKPNTLKPLIVFSAPSKFALTQVNNDVTTPSPSRLANTTPDLFIFCEIQIAFIKSSKPSNNTSFLFNPCALRGDISGFNPSFCFADFNCLVVNKHMIAFGRRELLKKKEDGGCSLQKEFFWF